VSLNDEELFQIGRNYVIGLIQKIVFDDYLPILFGKEYYEKVVGRQYPGYNSS
jgi:hypothetical protein